MEVAADLEGIRVCRHLHRLRHDAVLLVVRHRVQCADESRHVAACLLREIGIDGPEILVAPCAPDGLVDVACAAVISRDGETPVSEDIVGVEQVPGSCIGSLLDVQSLVHVRIDLQSVCPCGIVHELPHALGTCAGHRRGIQRRLYDGHGLELRGQPVPVEDVLENREVIRAQAEDVSHLGGHLLGIKDHVVLDRLVEGQCDERVHLLEPLDEYGIGHVGSEPDGIHVVFGQFLVHFHLPMDVPQAQQAVGHLGAVLLDGLVYAVHLLHFLEHQEHLGRQAVGDGFLQAVGLEFPDEGVHAGTEFGVLLDKPATGPELLAPRGLQEAQRQGENYYGLEKLHGQNLIPKLKPTAVELPPDKAYCMSGVRIVGPICMDMSSLTSKSCMYENTLASMACSK